MRYGSAMRHLRLIAFALVALLAGCVTAPDQLTSPVPDIMVKTPFVRNSLEMPAGRYVATSRNARGVYYKPDRTVIGLVIGRAIVQGVGLWRSDDGKEWGTAADEGKVFPFTEPPEIVP